MMADDPNNDEYKFAELDDLDSGLMGEEDPEFIREEPPLSQPEPPKKDIRRNALIAIGIIVLIMVLYKLIGSMFSSTKTDTITKPSIQPVPQITPQPITVQPTVEPTPVQQVQALKTESNGDLEKRVSSLELSQASLKSEVTALSQQVGTLSNNINSLNTQMTTLTQNVNNLAMQVEKQSEQIRLLMVRPKPRIIKPVVQRVIVEPIIYYIQAVIPGRAWLIATNGSTLTVREGIKIPGYGTVTLIDSMQGRIVTSSGRVIRFSQDDS